MASAGTVTVDFAAETAKFTAELKKVNSSLKRLEGDLKSVERVAGVALRFFSGAALLSFAKAAFSAADATADAAERAGIAVESFSRLQFAAGQADVEFSALTAGVAKFQTTLSKASTGNKEAIATLSRVGIEARNLRSLAVEDQLAEIAEAFSTITDPADRTRFAVELFGKAAGPQLVPFLAQGRDGIRELTAEADRLGITMSQTTADGINQADRAIKQLTGSLTALTSKFVAGLSIAILGPPDQVQRIDKEIDRLQTRVRQITQGTGGRDPRTVLGKDNPLVKELEAANVRIQQLFKEQRGLLGLDPLPPGTKTPITQFADEIESIDIEAIRAQKIEVDELALAYERLTQSVAQIGLQRAQESLAIVGDEVAQNQRRLEQQVTSEIEQELQTRHAMEQFFRDQRVQQEIAAENAILSAKQRAFGAGIQALQAFAGQSKKVAIALVLINKARAIAEAIQNTALGATLQLTTGDPYTAIARAAAVKAFGALQIAAIVASGFGEIQSINRSGGAPIGSPSNPINTQSLNDNQQLGATSQTAVQVIVQGNVIGNQEFIDDLIQDITDAVDDRDVVIIKPTSRNAQELLGNG